MFIFTKIFRDAINLIKIKNLDLKQTSEYKKFKEDFYGNIENKNILIGIVDKIISLTKDKTKKNKSYIFCLAKTVAFFIDLLVLLRNFLRKDSFKFVKRTIYYDYNRLVIRPSRYMKKLIS